MTVTLEKLGGDTRNSFIEKLKESFDAFVEENPGTPEGPVISRGEIEASLNRPGTEAYWALRDGQRVGGIVLTIDAKRARGDIELLFVVNGLKGKSVGADIVAAAEGRYPSVKTWELYTPLCRNAQHPLLCEQVRLQDRRVLQSQKPPRHARERGRGRLVLGRAVLPFREKDGRKRGDFLERVLFRRGIGIEWLKSGSELFYVAEQKVDVVNVLVDVPVAAVPALAGQPALNGAKPLPGG